MANQSFLSALGRNSVSIVLAGLLLAALSFVALVFTSKNFKVSVDFLVIQNQGGQDFYSQLKSAEYVGKVLGESVYSERFIDAVVATGKVDVNFLPGDKKERLKTWSETVNVSKNLNVGMLSVAIFENDQKKALRLAEAMAEVLTQKNVLFRGGDEKSVEVRVLSGPILEKNPSVKQIILVTIGGLVLGIVLGLLWLLLRFERGFMREPIRREEFAPQNVLNNEFAPLHDGRVVFHE